MDSAQIKLFIGKGVRKAKSLFSFHLSGNNISPETMIYIRDQLMLQIDEIKEFPYIN